MEAVLHMKLVGSGGNYAVDSAVPVPSETEPDFIRLSFDTEARGGEYRVRPFRFDADGNSESGCDGNVLPLFMFACETNHRAFQRELMTGDEKNSYPLLSSASLSWAFGGRKYEFRFLDNGAACDDLVIADTGAAG